jgi:hypothetical protein
MPVCHKCGLVIMINRNMYRHLKKNCTGVSMMTSKQPIKLKLKNVQPSTPTQAINAQIAPDIMPDPSPIVPDNSTSNDLIGQVEQLRRDIAELRARPPTILNDNCDEKIEKELLMAFLEWDKNELKNMHSYIYIIKGTDTNTKTMFYKVGETQRHPINRMKEHGLCHKLILMEFVTDCIKVETDFLIILRNHDEIRCRHDLGKEYFECKDDDTIKGILHEYLSNVLKK